MTTTRSAPARWRTLPGYFSTAWTAWVATITLALMTFVIGSNYAAGDWRRWPALALLLLLMVIQRLDPEPRYGATGAFVQVAVLFALTVAVAALGADPSAVVIMGFVLCVHAIFAMPGKQGFAWIALFVLALLVYLLPVYTDRLAGLYTVLGTAAGFFFIGSAAYAQKRAESASAESARLLGELQAAHARLRDDAARAEALAVAEERNRVARELHDTLGHRLTVAAVQLEGAQKLIARDPEKAARMVETVREQVAAGLQELRSTVSVLRAPAAPVSAPTAAAPARDLPAALAQLAADFAAATGIAVQTDLPAALPPLRAEQRHALQRAAQEALTNVQRHARARTVWLRLAVAPAPGGSVTTLCVEDDGVGLAATQAADDDTARGFGLQGLAERAAALGGHCETSARPGGGTTLCFTLPQAAQQP